MALTPFSSLLPTAYIPLTLTDIGCYDQIPQQFSEESSSINDPRVLYMITPYIHQVCTHADSQMTREALHDLLTRMNQECREDFRQALTKQEGYFYRFFSSESWEEWSERQTPLGKVVSAILYDASHPDGDKVESLSSKILDQANAQAEKLLERFSAAQTAHPATFLSQLKMGLTAFSYFFPSVSLIPGAEATPMDCSPSCEEPIGSYQQSCVNSTVTLLPEGLCSLKTSCATMLAAVPHQLNQFFFPPHTTPILGNQNGTLTVIHMPPHSISSETANAGFRQILEKMTSLQHKLDDPAIDSKDKQELESEKKELKKREEVLLGLLPSGSIVSVVGDEEGHPKIISPSEFKKQYPSFIPMQKFADLTGGVVGISKRPKDFPLVVDTILDYILRNAPSDKPLDMAFVLDTTSSMDDDIDQIKTNLVRYLEKMQGGVTSGVRVALLEYRDSGDEFVNHIQTDFTADINSVIQRVQKIGTGGGNDVPEALYDALLVAQNKLSWNSEASRVVLAITDAPAHPKTVDKLHDDQFVIDQYRKADIDIAFYPIITRA